jgi:hypothetical protein
MPGMLKTHICKFERERECKVYVLCHASGGDLVDGAVFICSHELIADNRGRGNDPLAVPFHLMEILKFVSRMQDC